LPTNIKQSRIISNFEIGRTYRTSEVFKSITRNNNLPFSHLSVCNVHEFICAFIIVIILIVTLFNYQTINVNFSEKKHQENLFGKKNILAIMETNAMDIESNPVLELVRNPFSCLTCNIVFNKKEIRDDHYKSEWHRYNLHRKLANLPPITLDKFETRIIANEKTENQKEQQNCDICQKKFTNDKQYKNHLMSKKHKEKMKNVNTKNQISETVNIKTKMDISDETDIDSDYENSIELNDCLFCDHHSKNVKRNLKHMMIKHSFFVPDPEYCIDQKGLLISLASKIYQDYQCIWCNDSGKQIIIFI